MNPTTEGLPVKLYYNQSQITGAHILDDGENEIAEVFSAAIGNEEAARLARLFAASETMQSALRSVFEWCDLIEQNYPDMTFTKAVRAAVAEAEGKDAEPVKNYAVTGRAYGDDEASTEIYNRFTRSAAIAAFKQWIAPNGATAEALKYEGEGFEGCWIDAVIESDSPLRMD
jgi:hypothetical protein